MKNKTPHRSVKFISNSLSLILFSLAVNTYAGVNITPVSNTITTGNSFTIEVLATSMPSVDSASLQFSFDPTVVRVDSVDKGSSAFCDLVVRDIDNTTGTIGGIFALAHQPDGSAVCTAPTGNFTAFTITMTAIGIGESALVLDQTATGFGWTSPDNPGVVIIGTDPVAANVSVTELDTDGDGIVDSMDNCINHSNNSATDPQRDTDSDLIGNRCDPDFNNDGVVNFIDLGSLKAVWIQADANHDLNGDGVVNFIDMGILKSFWTQAPGPSGTIQ